MSYKIGNKVAIIGHGGHGSSLLASTIASHDYVCMIVGNDIEKERGITISEPRSFIINNSYSKELFINSNTRNHRRKEKRSTTNIKNKYKGRTNPFLK